MAKKEKTKKKEVKRLKKCPQCSIHIAKDLKFCFNCDYIFPEKKKKSSKKKAPKSKISKH